MDPISSKTALAAAGASGEKVYVDDVFSTYLYDGIGDTAQTITNGIDLSGEGGMVLQKRRSSSGHWFLNDTENGANNFLFTNFTNALSVGTSGSSFNSDGFTIGSENNLHNTGDNVASWTFRKAPGFFDVVTYTGTGSARTVAHNLGSVPGMILIKCTSEAADWSVYHRSLGATKNMHLNNNSVADTQTGVFNDTEPTATHFTVNWDGDVNKNGATYVAYVFAHNDQQFGTNGGEAIIHCGTFNGGGVLNSNTIEVNTGFEPQWVLIKRTNAVQDWYLIDTMRGMGNDGNNVRMVFPSTNDAEGGSFRLWPYQNGFAFDEDLGGSSAEWIYMAIRRPHKPPEAATDVFAVANADGSAPRFNSGFPVDLAIEYYTGGGFSNYPGWGSRLQGQKFLKSSSNAAEATLSNYYWDYMDGWNSTSSANTTLVSHMFKRAPGFFDIVAYTGTGSARTINHNLGVVPEILLTKCRSGSNPWFMGSEELTDWTKALKLNGTSAEFTSTSLWNSTAPTSSVFSLGTNVNNNQSGQTFVAYLFASLDGISKVGSYTGTGSDIDVDCGFTAGARFILVKRTDSTGNWYVWDSVRGIVSGNDPYLLLNSDAAQVTNTDYIDPLNAGFTVTSSASSELNASGGTYLFLAIA